MLNGMTEGGVPFVEPGSGQRANVPEDLRDFAEWVDASLVKVADRPVNLADRLPSGHVTSDPADEILAAALAESSYVEWPRDLALTFTDPDGVTVPEGRQLVGTSGAIAHVQHAGPGFKVSGRLAGIEIEYTGGGALPDVGVHVLPGSSRAIVESVTVRGGLAGIAVGSLEGDEDHSADALVIGCSVSTDAPSSFGYRVDGSVGVTLAHCVSTGSTLDAIKLRRRARQFRLIGGRYSGAAAGDGLDGFAGAEDVFIGGGVIFHDNSQNGMVIKTDDIAGFATIPDQLTEYGLPKRLVIDGVHAIGNGGTGISLHRSDSTDSDVAAGKALPWIRGAVVSNVVTAQNVGFGMFANLRAAHLAGIIAQRNGQDGFRVHDNARDITMSGLHALGNGVVGGTWDGFNLAGKRLWLSQCMAYGVDPDAVNDADLTSAAKFSRFGYRIPTGAQVRMVQCGAYDNATAPLSDSDSSTALLDCDMPGLLTGGLNLLPDQALAFRDGATFRKLVRLATTGADPVGSIGDTTLAQLVLNARPGGSVVAAAQLLPQATATYNLGSGGNRWLNLYLSGGVQHLGGPLDKAGTGSPEGAVAAFPGSTFRRTDGAAGSVLYVKQTGTGTTGWLAIA